jgi:hypothetical protein
MRRALVTSTIAVCSYLALWTGTSAMQPSRALRDHIQRTEAFPPGDEQFDSFEAVSPFIVHVVWRWGSPGVGQHGMEGWFVSTPWGTRTLSIRETWISCEFRRPSRA